LTVGDLKPNLSPANVRRHLTWLLVAFALIYPFPYFQRLNNPNENVRVWMTRALVEYHELDLGHVTRDWGFVDDKAKAADGRLVSSKAPGVSLLGVPVLGAQSLVRRALGEPAASPMQATWVLRMFTVTLPLVGFLLFFARWAEAITRSPVARDLLVLGLGVGTPLYPYSLMFAGHAPGAALAFLAFAFTQGAPGSVASLDTRTRLGLAGLFAGLAVVFEYQLAVVAAILAVWALARHGRGAWAMALGLLPSVVILAVYHTCLFGRPWSFPYGHLDNPTYAGAHHSQGFYGLVLPSAGALASLAFSPDIGLFAFSPFLLAGVAGVVLAVRRGPRDDGIVVLYIALLLLLFQAGLTNWRAGWSVGPRYILAIAPFLAGAVAWCWTRVPARIATPVLGGLVAVSVVLCGVSGAMFPHYPPEYDNPVFELAFPLLRDGYAPYDLGRMFGLRGAWSMVPLALGLAIAWIVAMGSLRISKESGPVRTMAGALLAATILWGMSRVGRATEPQEADATQMVQAIWEPKP
jgi:hypothetical protein